MPCLSSWITFDRESGFEARKNILHLRVWAGGQKNKAEKIEGPLHSAEEGRARKSQELARHCTDAMVSENNEAG